jgi:hypothetical protein
MIIATIAVTYLFQRDFALISVLEVAAYETKVFILGYFNIIGMFDLDPLD